MNGVSEDKLILVLALFVAFLLFWKIALAVAGVVIFFAIANIVSANKKDES